MTRDCCCCCCCYYYYYCYHHHHHHHPLCAQTHTQNILKQTDYTHTHTHTHKHTHTSTCMHAHPPTPNTYIQSVSGGICHTSVKCSLQSTSCISKLRKWGKIKRGRGAQIAFTSLTRQITSPPCNTLHKYLPKVRGMDCRLNHTNITKNTHTKSWTIMIK